MDFKTFLTGSGALIIGILGATAFMFPMFAVFIVIGYLFIKENTQDKNF